MTRITQLYKEKIYGLLQKSRNIPKVTELNVYQKANEELLPIIDSMIAENLLSGSEVRNFQNLAQLLEFAKSGSACVLMMEHYSNFDLPCLSYLLRKMGAEGQAVSDALVAIAGIKLSEANPVVVAFSEAYTRIVIYPSRSLENLKEAMKDPKEALAEFMKGTAINRAAMKALAERKKSGDIVLVFPSGTRYRPWEPTTKRGVREIDSYIKGFDKMVAVSINGNILRINPDGEMLEDLIEKDTVIYNVSPVIDCAEFRENVKKEHHHFGEDKKQAIVDELMRQLDKQHGEVEAKL